MNMGGGKMRIRAKYSINHKKHIKLDFVKHPSAKHVYEVIKGTKGVTIKALTDEYAVIALDDIRLKSIRLSNKASLAQVDKHKKTSNDLLQSIAKRQGFEVKRISRKEKGHITKNYSGLLSRNPKLIK